MAQGPYYTTTCYYIVINNLGVGTHKHTYTHMHINFADKSNIKKPGMQQPLAAMPGFTI